MSGEDVPGTFPIEGFDCTFDKDDGGATGKKKGRQGVAPITENKKKKKKKKNKKKKKKRKKKKKKKKIKEDQCHW